VNAREILGTEASDRETEKGKQRAIERDGQTEKPEDESTEEGETARDEGCERDGGRKGGRNEREKW
jgi:hypothetical protein